jgi:glycosyltransferase involved in cell wall biosynthesis
MLRLAYFSPLPPGRSGIADYSRALLPRLAGRADINLFHEQPESVEPSLHDRWPIHPLDAFRARRWAFDLALYQMGNSSHHQAMYPYLLRYPGLVTLHESGLHHFLADTTLGQGDFAAYTRELGYTLGVAGVAFAHDIYAGRRPHPLYELPLNDRLVDRSLAVAVHSRAAEAEIAGRRPRALLRYIPALVEPWAGNSQRDRLGLPADAPVFAAAGQVTPEKQPALALRAFSRLRQRWPEAHFVFVGENHPAVDLGAHIAASSLAGAVTCTGHVATLDDFVGWLAAADVVLALRQPTIGESSAAALRALAAGRPLIVFDSGWYGELPGEVAIKVKPLDEDALLAAMEELAASPERRAAMGRAAVAYVARQHDPAAVAAAYLALIEELLARLAPGGALRG